VLDLWYSSGWVKGRLVALVVPQAAVADQVDQKVAPKALAVGKGQPRRHDHPLRVVGVDVHDGDAEALGQVAGKQGAARVVGSVVKPIWLLAMMWIVPPVV
jgi:hypothetical protein